jgi:hypothetical protein
MQKLRTKLKLKNKKKLYYTVQSRRNLYLSSFSSILLAGKEEEADQYKFLLDCTVYLSINRQICFCLVLKIFK